MERLLEVANVSPASHLHRTLEWFRISIYNNIPYFYFVFCIYNRSSIQKVKNVALLRQKITDGRRNANVSSLKSLGS